MHYAVYDKRTTTGYKHLGVVKVIMPNSNPRDAAYQIVQDKLGLNEEDVWIQVSIEIQYKLNPIN